MNRILATLLSVIALSVAACEHNDIADEDGGGVIPPPPTILGTSTTFGILAGSAVTCTTAGTVKANVGVSPGTAITGFPEPCSLTGEIHRADPVAAQAQLDLTDAYNYLKGLPCGTTVSPADIGGRTLEPGVYCVASSLGVTGTVTLHGDDKAVFVFQIGSTLTTSVGSEVKLTGGVKARNVWWVVGSSATLGTSTTFRGTIAALTSITLNANTTLLGRALARNGAVTIGANVITLP
jgi:hypothetical protein